MSDERRAWSLLTKSYGGAVSILRDLTLTECRAAYERLDEYFGVTSTSYERKEGGSWSYGGRLSDSAAIQMREIFGPDDWDRAEIEVWPKWPKSEFIRLGDPRHRAPPV